MGGGAIGPTDLLPTMAIFLCFCCGAIVASRLVSRARVVSQSDELSAAVRGEASSESESIEASGIGNNSLGEVTNAQ